MPHQCTIYKGQCHNAQYGNQFQDRIRRSLHETVPVKMTSKTYSCNTVHVCIRINRLGWLVATTALVG